MAVLIIILLILAASSVFAVILTQRRNKEMEKLITAARNIVQEDMLDYAIKNPNHSAATPPPQPRRLMLCLQVNTRPVQRFVFDPGKCVSIGRDARQCQLQLQDPHISLVHCRIFLNQGKVILQDTGTANGTELRRSLFHRYELKPRTGIPLRSGDIICLASVRMKVRLFVFDDMTM